MTDIAKYGPWAVIAGGSEGVGAEFAEQLAGDGFDLVLIARKPGPLEDTARQCRDFGAQVRTLAIDLLDPDAVARITAQTADIEVGLLIYNAGANTCSKPFLDAELSEFGRVIDLNVTRMLQLVQHFARPMRSRGRGGILVVGSMAATHGSMRQSVYTGVKAFSRLFAEPVAGAARARRRCAGTGAGRDPHAGHGPGRPELRRAGAVGVRTGRRGPRGVGEPGQRPGVHRWRQRGRGAPGQRPDRAAIVFGAHRAVQELLGQK